MSSLTLDLRQALRGLVRRPSFALVATLTLGLATGAATAVFAVVDAALLAPLPYAAPDRLVRIYERDIVEGREFGQVAIADFRDWRASTRGLASAAVTRYATATLTGRGDAERLFALRVSASFLDVLGVAPVLGRGFLPADEQAQAARVAIISHGLFERRFGGDPAIVGTSVTLDGRPTTIVGVLPAAFRSPLGGDTEVYLPDAFESLAGDANRARRMHAFAVIARLADGVAWDQAREELLAIGRRLENEHPRDNKGHQPNAVPLRDAMTRTAAPLLRAASAAVALLLVLAAVNVAGLALARGLGRQHDVALRAALGARGAGLLRVPLLENLAVAAAGGLLGAILAAWGAGALAAFAGPELAPAGAPLSWRLLAFAAFASAAAGLGCGLAPALAALRQDLVSVVKGGSSALTPSGSRLRLRGALVGAQVALACVLLVGCGLLLRSMAGLGAVDPGFDPAGVVTFRTSLPAARYAEEPARVAVQATIEQRLRSLPGVRRVALAYTLPFTNLSTTGLHVVGQPAEGTGAPMPEVGYNSVSADYFAAIGVPLRRGRFFDARDTADAAPVVIVNQALAERFFAGLDPVGQRVSVGNSGQAAEIVGVVGNVLRAGLDDGSAPEMFHVSTQDVTPSPVIVVRAETAALASLPEAIRRELRAIDADLPVFGFRSLEEVVAGTLAPRRLLSILLAVFGVAALVLAGLGVFGVASQLVVERRREIAVRMALGARAKDVVRMVVERGLLPVVVGLIAGAAAAAAGGRFLGAMLFGVSATDPMTHVGVLAVLLAAATVACLLPAQRAVAVAPGEVLRGD